MKLELKHLAPYLPFKIKVLDRKVKIMNSYSGHSVNWCSLEYAIKMQFKPILRPISDLSILIIEEFEKYDGKRNGKANEEIINLFCEENGVDENIENMELKSLPYECVEFMFKNHYDFFGLIEKKLAIDINKINH
jgi:hypothetical protein